MPLVAVISAYFNSQENPEDFEKITIASCSIDQVNLVIARFKNAFKEMCNALPYPEDGDYYTSTEAWESSRYEFIKDVYPELAGVCCVQTSRDVSFSYQAVLGTSLEEFDRRQERLHDSAVSSLQRTEGNSSLVLRSGSPFLFMYGGGPELP